MHNNIHMLTALQFEWLRIMNVQAGLKLKEQWRWKTLCKNISILGWRWDMKSTHLTCGYFVSDKVQINLHMLCTLMMDRVGWHIHNTNVITVNNSSFGRHIVKLEKKIMNPTCFSHTICNTHVFGFDTGPGSRILTFGGPR